MKTGAPLDAFQRHLRALWRAETLIARFKLAALLKKSGLLVFAGLIAVFGLAMLNFAAYRALTPLWGEVWALIAVAFGDFAVAGLLILVAASGRDTSELTLANELRDQAIAALDLDARLAVDDVTRVVRRPMQYAECTSATIGAIVAALLRHRGK